MRTMSSPEEAAHRLAVIITTSPTPSAPSTDLLSTVFASYLKHCPYLTQCDVIVVFDTYDRITDQDRLKKGHVTAELARNYETYKVKAKDLILSQYMGSSQQEIEVETAESREPAEYGFGGGVPFSVSQTRDQRVTFIEPTIRLGFALAVRSALRIADERDIPYVWIQQHDWALAADIPIGPLLDLMQDHHNNDVKPIRYVCFPNGRLREHDKLDHVTRWPALRMLTSSHTGDYSTSSRPDVKVPLTPLFFWHDKPHLASTKHYLARIFPSSLAVPRGSFIEDTVGHRAREQMKQGVWAKWACWLYYPDQGKTACIKHLNGRTWKGIEYTAEIKAAVESSREELILAKNASKSVMPARSASQQEYGIERMAPESNVAQVVLS